MTDPALDHARERIRELKRENAKLLRLLRAVVDTARDDPMPRAFDKLLDEIDALREDAR